MDKVFISYSRSDVKHSELLEVKLNEAGFQTWRDKTNIPIGSVWNKDIDEALAQCVALIVIVSPDSINSVWVTYEWVHALSLGKIVIPLIFEMVDKRSIHTKLRERNLEDFTVDSDVLWTNLFDTLRNIYQQIPSILIPNLLNMIRGQQDNIMVEQVKRTLLSIGPVAIPVLIESLSNRDYQIRRMAAIVLGEMRSKEAVPYLIKRLRDGDHPVRTSAVNALGEIGDISASQEVILSLYDIEPMVRLSAARALQTLRPIEGVKELVYVLQNDPNSAARMYAAMALGEIGDEKAEPALIAALSDESLGYGDQPICEHAANSLVQLRTKTSLEAVRSWQSNRRTK